LQFQICVFIFIKQNDRSTHFRKKNRELEALEYQLEVNFQREHIYKMEKLSLLTEL